ncbi:MAG: aspartate-semialdehyde dehydrogenase, partial [Clostridia bacterium]
MIKCAIVGASGLVGNMFLKVLEEKKLKIDEYVLFASYRSKGKKI